MNVFIKAHSLVASAISSVNMNSKSEFLPRTCDPFCFVLLPIVSQTPTLGFPASTRKSYSNHCIFHPLFHYPGHLNSKLQHNLTCLFLPCRALTTLLLHLFCCLFHRRHHQSVQAFFRSCLHYYVSLLSGFPAFSIFPTPSALTFTLAMATQSILLKIILILVLPA